MCLGRGRGEGGKSREQMFEAVKVGEGTRG